MIYTIKYVHTKSQRKIYCVGSIMYKKNIKINVFTSLDEKSFPRYKLFDGIRTQITLRIQTHKDVIELFLSYPHPNLG